MDNLKGSAPEGTNIYFHETGLNVQKQLLKMEIVLRFSKIYF